MKIIIVIAVLLIVIFILMCNMIGKKFLKNFTRKNPGEKFCPDIDISFYKNGPLYKIAQEGISYMKTLPHEEVYITSRDGLKLHATYFPSADHSQNIVIGIHGFQSSAWDEYAPHIAYYRSIGFGMLLPDDRGHNFSEGQYITMGVKDRLDCIDWAKYIVQRFGKYSRILLHGISMGGAAVLSASGEDDLPEQVIGIVSDCGFTSIKEAFSFQIQSMYHMKPDFILKICQWYAKHKAGFDFEEAEPIEQVKNAKVPILFVQGEDDFLVPEDMVKRLYDACSSRKKLLIVKKASHAESVAVDPESYHQAIHQLFKI